MKSVTFKGGIHPGYQKELTNKKAIVELSAPLEIIIPLSQHIGAPSKPCVEKGDHVLAGQIVGEPGGFVSSPVHSSVSGKVKAVEPRPTGMGTKTPCVVIENDGEASYVEFEKPEKHWSDTDASLLKEKISAAGIVGMGGAAFPTHVKLSPPKEKVIDTVILNGAECEPYLTADHRVMLEHPDAVVEGLMILKKILGAKKAIIGVESNKNDALDALKKASKDFDASIFSLEVKYPQGAEKQLIDACLGRQVPSGGLPMDVGVVVHNAETAFAIHEAIQNGTPLIKRVLTITGQAISSPANYLVKIGTPVKHVIEAAGGVKGDMGKLILGGPMMGFTQYTDEVPVTKGTSGILLLSNDEVSVTKDMPCIRCGRCVAACPMHLAPTEIVSFGKYDMFEKAKEVDALDCMECGSCAYVCPSVIPIVQHIRLAKAGIMELKNKAS